MKARVQHHNRNHTLPNPLLKGRANQIEATLIDQRIEADPWYRDNVKRIIDAQAAGKEMVAHVVRNVIARLYAIASHRAERSFHNLNHA